MPDSIQLQRRFVFLVAIVFLLCPLFPSHMFGQFPINPIANVPISTSIDGQSDPVIASDGAGGAFIAWNDLRSGQGYDIYAQHVNASGIVQWDSNGTVICAESGIQNMVVMIPDGAGGAILAWEDKRTDMNYDIYAQRLNSSGTALWGAGGIPVVATDGDQQAPCIVSDGQGGAIIAWNDTRPGGASNIYAQRLDASGNPLWQIDGVPVLKATVSSIFDPAAMISDGSHGAIIGWDDARSTEPQTDIYVQRLDAAGNCRWDTNGAEACLDPASQAGTRLATDGAGGAIVCWTDWRAQSKPDGIYGDDGIYAQHVDSAGVALWTKDGVKVCDTTDRQEQAEIVSDGAGGAILAWEDKRKGSEFDLYAQRVDSSGSVRWDSGGVPVCTAFGDQGFIRMASDSNGGALVAWIDNRVGNYDIYSTRISDKGISLWPLNGVGITTADGPQALGDMTFNKKNGAILAWTDGRGGNAGSSNIFAQNVNLDGYLGLAPELTLPKNDAVISTDSVRLVWYPLLPRPSRYWLEFGLDSTFTYRSTDSTITDTTYVVKNLSAGHSYWWKIRGYDNGPGPFSAVWKVSVETGVTEVSVDPNAPKAFALSQNFPNPFNPSTVVSYQLPVASRVELIIYDILGQEVATLVHQVQQAGRYSVTWNANGKASGVYVYRLRAGSFVDTKKLVLLR
jgi:hypothetical protein